MAKLGAMPQQAIIDQFKGQIDFYYYKGTPCARKWPIYPPRWRSEQEQQTQKDFAYAAALYKQMSPSVITAYQALPQTGTLTWRDWIVRSYISGIKYTSTWTLWQNAQKTDPKVALIDFWIDTYPTHRTIRWRMDIPCCSRLFLSVSPFKPTPISRKRRGLLHIADYELFFLSYYAHTGYPYSTPSTEKWVIPSIPSDAPGVWFFISFQAINQITGPYSPSSSPVLFCPTWHS